MLEGLFLQNDVLGTAMQASVVRNDVIANNIANAEVPGYKKKAVRFETYLRDALEDAKRTGRLDLSNVRPTLMTEHAGYNYRLDESNVDIEQEMVDLYQNAVKYDTLAGGVINNYKRINLVMSTR